MHIRFPLTTWGNALSQRLVDDGIQPLYRIVSSLICPKRNRILQAPSRQRGGFKVFDFRFLYCAQQIDVHRMVGSNRLNVYLPEGKRTSIYVHSTFLTSLSPCHLATLPPGACPAEPSATSV
jgi:hypothetical protein